MLTLPLIHLVSELPLQAKTWMLVLALQTMESYLLQEFLGKYAQMYHHTSHVHAEVFEIDICLEAMLMILA